MSFVEIRDLEKRFGRVKAVSGLSFDVEKGEIYGFLGPNGAGKTTTIRILVGLIEADKGTVQIDVPGSGIAVRQHIGYLPERVSFYGNLSVEENLQFFCEMKGCSKDIIEELLKDFELEDQREKKCKHLSKGMAQRLGIAQTLIGNPDLLILDEPTAGLDPNIRRWVKNKILSLKDTGKTILLSSHVLAEVQELCDRVGILKDGEMLAEDDIESLGSKLTLKERLELQVEPLGKALRSVEKLDYVDRARLFKGRLVLYCSGDRKMDVIKKLVEGEFDITDFHVKKPDLEEVFVRLTGGGGV
ncbi:MAG: ABC transporter ATP-binding protein [Candidatus Saliniplasma sp.]